MKRVTLAIVGVVAAIVLVLTFYFFSGWPKPEHRLIAPGVLKSINQEPG